ncbi:hypothetical protein KY285_002482 [Solanum tuberosum]|nr:hypothetical protein KY285_002482 [Solanum tuberosum]
MQLFHFTIARRSSLPRVSLHERQQEIIKTVHDEPLMPEAIWSELPWMSSHQCDQSSTPSTGDSVFSDVSKLQAQWECTSTRDGESKEGKPYLLMAHRQTDACSHAGFQSF